MLFDLCPEIRNMIALLILNLALTLKGLHDIEINLSAHPVYVELSLGHGQLIPGMVDRVMGKKAMSRKNPDCIFSLFGYIVVGSPVRWGLLFQIRWVSEE